MKKKFLAQDIFENLGLPGKSSFLESMQGSHLLLVVSQGIQIRSVQSVVVFL